MINKTALVCLTAGVESTAALLWAKANAKEVMALHVIMHPDFWQQGHHYSREETEYVKNLCEDTDTKLYIKEYIPFDGEYKFVKDMMYWTLAAQEMMLYKNINWVLYGANSGLSYSGDEEGDGWFPVICEEMHSVINIWGKKIDDTNHLEIQHGDKQPVLNKAKMFPPLGFMSKAAQYKMIPQRLRKHIFTCWEPKDDLPCGHCKKCQEMEKIR